MPLVCRTAGYVAIIGKPNAGKSTLLNNVLGQKLSAVTRKAQTTRHRILGIDSGDGYQMILLDTPGVIKVRSDGLCCTDDLFCRDWACTEAWAAQRRIVLQAGGMQCSSVTSAHAATTGHDAFRDWLIAIRINVLRCSWRFSFKQATNQRQTGMGL